jgi:peptidoglycan/LPS O-acetylase OafA/YrhL
MTVTPPSETTIADPPNLMPSERPYASQAAETAPGSPSTWSILALLRFVLASIVVLSHYQALLSVAAPLGVTVFNGSAAVIGFFMISGYSIAASIDRDNCATRFYIRRLARIAPIFVTGCAFSLVPWLLSPSGIVCWGSVQRFPALPTILLNFLGLQTAFTPAIATYAQSWSLLPECMLYLATPLLSRTKASVVGTIAVLSASCYLFNHGGDAAMFRSTLYLAWAWLAGYILYKQGLSVLAAVLLIVAPAYLLPMDVHQDSHSPFVAVSCAVVLIFSRQINAGSASKVLNWLGDVSYPLYLTHVATMVILNILCPSLALFAPSWLYVASVAVAAVLLSVVDHPCRRAIRSLQKRATRINSTIEVA